MIEKARTFQFQLICTQTQDSNNCHETIDTSPEEKLEIKCENDQYKIPYKAELQLYLKQKGIITPVWGKHMHSYLGNAQQAYSIE